MSCHHNNRHRPLCQTTVSRFWLPRSCNIIIGQSVFRCKIPKRLPIITACSTSGAEPNITGFIVINFSNPITGKTLLGCKMLKGFSIIVINTWTSRSKRKVSVPVFQKIPESVQTYFTTREISKGVKSGCIYTCANRIVRDPYATCSCLWLDETCEGRISSVKNSTKPSTRLAAGLASICLVCLIAIIIERVLRNDYSIAQSFCFNQFYFVI